MNHLQLSFKGRISSFRCALLGIWEMISSQHNARIHAVATCLVVTISFYFGLTKEEWCWIVLSIVSVWTAETLNTAFEFLTDVASPQFHPLAAKAKDVAAGAVLITASGSALIGFLILGPHVMASLRS